MSSPRARKLPALAGLFALSLILLVAQGTAQLLDSIKHTETPEYWSRDYDKSLARAKAEDKPLVIMVSGVNCPPCEVMRRNTLPDPAVKKALEKWVPVYLDGNEDVNEAVVRKFNAIMFPTFLVLDSGGRELGRLVIPFEQPDLFVPALNVIVERAAGIRAATAALAKTPDDAALLKKRGELYLRTANLIGEYGSLESENADPGPEALKNAKADFEKCGKLDPANKTGVAADIAYVLAFNTAATDLAKAAGMLKQVLADYPDCAIADQVGMLHALAVFKTTAKDDGNVAPFIAFRDSLEKQIKAPGDPLLKNYARLMLEKIKGYLEQMKAAKAAKK